VPIVDHLTSAVRSRFWRLAACGLVDIRLVIRLRSPFKSSARPRPQTASRGAFLAVRPHQPAHKFDQIVEANSVYRNHQVSSSGPVRSGRGQHKTAFLRRSTVTSDPGVKPWCRAARNGVWINLCGRCIGGTVAFCCAASRDRRGHTWNADCLESVDLSHLLIVAPRLADSVAHGRNVAPYRFRELSHSINSRACRFVQPDIQRLCVAASKDTPKAQVKRAHRRKFSRCFSSVCPPLPPARRIAIRVA
jgi:hypothetical protein